MQKLIIYIFILCFPSIVVSQLSVEETKYYNTLEDSLRSIQRYVFYSKKEWKKGLDTEGGADKHFVKCCSFCERLTQNI